MKTLSAFLTTLVLAAFVSGCSFVTSLKNIRTINASDTLVSEERSVSGFTAIEINTIGKLTLTQGDGESVKVSGPDNVVPLIRTRVSGGKLVIDTEDNVAFTNLNDQKMLTFEITVKDLKAVTVNGLGSVTMDGLKGAELSLTMNGAGAIREQNMSVETLKVEINGLGSVEVSGSAQSMVVEISGAGNVEAENLKVATAKVNVNGLGSATLYVTDRLTGEIGGAGNVNYYGSPELKTNTQGIGRFVSKGSK